MVESISLLFAGALLTLLSQWALKYFERDTHASNRVLEMRLEAMQSIWLHFIRVRRRIAISEHYLLGRGSYDKVVYDSLTVVLGEFRQEVDLNQFLFDPSVTSALYGMEQRLDLFIKGGYIDGDVKGAPVTYLHFAERHLAPAVERLEQAWNDTFSRTTQKLQVRLRVEPTEALEGLRGRQLQEYEEDRRQDFE